MTTRGTTDESERGDAEMLDEDEDEAGDVLFADRGAGAEASTPRHADGTFG